MRLLTLLLACVSFSAFADDWGPLSLNEYPTKMEALTDFYYQGTMPTTDDLLGLWSGRNYHLGEENSPVGLFLGCFWNEPGNHGPLFPDEFFGCAHSGIKKGYGEPNRYDSGITKSEVDSKRLASRLVTVRFSEEEGACYDNCKQDFLEDYQGTECFKMYKGYIIRVLKRHGKITEAGYLFKKLTCEK